MKTLKWLLVSILAVAAVLIVQSYSVKSVELREGIRGIRLSPEGFASLKALHNLNKKLYTVDKEGVVRPAKGYVIRYEKSLKAFFITANLKDRLRPITKDGSQDLGGGLIFRCWSAEVCDLCQPNFQADGWYCTQIDCECFEEIIVTGKGAVQYETSTGVHDVTHAR